MIHTRDGRRWLTMGVALLGLCVAPARAELSAERDSDAAATIRRVFEPTAIATYDGSGNGAPLDSAQFRNLYGFATAERRPGDVPSSQDLLARAQTLINRGDVPIAIVDVDYARATGRDTTIRGELSAVTALAESAFAWDPTFVLDPALIVVRRGERRVDVREFVVSIDGRDYALRPGDRFRLCDPPTDGTVLPFTVRWDVEGVRREAHGVVPYTTLPTRPFTVDGTGDGDRGAPPPTPPECGPLGPPPVGCVQQYCSVSPCWGLQDVVATTPFDATDNEPGQDSQWGSLGVRIYPASGTVTPLGNNQCDVKLVRPLVLVDGIDIMSVRNQNSILADFHDAIESFRALGLDVITLDWNRGRDFLQRNAYAVQAFLVNTIPQIAVPQVVAGNKVIVIGGSMGAEVSRFALRDAEVKGLDHNTGLWVSFDGPHRGANIPITLQAGVDYFAPFIQAAKDFQDALNAPAPRQLLLRTRTGWNPSQLWFQNYYVPTPRHGAYYAERPGLPTTTRNVAIANGSGTGSVVADVPLFTVHLHDHDVTHSVPPVFLSAATGFSAVSDAVSLSFVLQTKADALSAPYPNNFVGRLEFDLDPDDLPFPFNLIIGSNGVHAEYSRSLALGAAGQKLDVDPGSTRSTPGQIHQALTGAFNMPGLPAFDLSTLVSLGLDRHAFMPTNTALDLPPGADPTTNAFTTSWWEKCNTPHVSQTASNIGFLFDEVRAFAYGLPAPDQPPRYETKCGEPEARDTCLELVDWYPDTAHPTVLEAWWDTANCYVTPVPSGFTGSAVGQHYYVNQASVSCPAGSTSNPNGNGTCVRLTLPSSMQYATYLGLPPFLRFPPYSGQPPADQCPAGTSFQYVDSEGKILCAVTPLTGYGPTEFFLGPLGTSGTGLLFLPHGSCAIGIPELAGGTVRCRIGTAPDGVTPFELNGSFYYDGAD